MILCHQIERLEPSLEDLARLMELYRNGDYTFPDAAVKWLDEAEKMLAVLRVTGSSELATLKGRVIKAPEVLHTDIEKPSRSRVRATRNVAAMEALERGETILREALTEARERLDRFEEKLCEGLTALCLQVELPPLCSPRSAWLSQVWRVLADTAPTKPLSLYLAASLSMVDRLYLLDRVLGRLYEG